MRRYKLIRIPVEFLVEWMSGFAELLTTLPPDTMVVDAQYDITTRQFLLVCESQSWDPVTEGARIPALEIRATNRRPSQYALSADPIADQGPQKSTVG
jgi:hypothetical protein